MLTGGAAGGAAAAGLAGPRPAPSMKGRWTEAPDAFGRIV